MFKTLFVVLLAVVAPALAESPAEPMTFSDNCSLPLASGSCLALFPSWGYEDGKCKRFNYGGCGGNGNRFSSRDECEAACDLTGKDVCELPPITGMCRAYFVKWTYYEGDCIQFVYGGCGGNDNRFDTYDACMQRCGNKPNCDLPIVQGPCEAAIPSFGLENDVCIRFLYGGCRGNSNRFRSKAECERKCDIKDRCELPIVTGPCMANMPRWGHEDGKCRRFTYGGCQGNANRFETKGKCLNACDDDSEVKRRCTLPLTTGPCRAALTKWGYEDGECTTFTYGGCQGNKNRFNSKKQCEKVCEVETENKCDLPLETGPCRAAFTKWGYEDGECKTFTYGGCDGNANRFNTKKSCVKACDEKKPRKCMMKLRKPLRPNCEVTKSGQKWGYDEEAGECIRFNWNNCRGTQNKFGSKRACEKACSD